MKARTRLVLIILVILGALATKTAFGKDTDLGNTRHKHLFILKLDKEFVGATVEVLYFNGDVVLSRKLEKKRVSIDFAHSKDGTYTIRVVRGAWKKEFQYQKI